MAPPSAGALADPTEYHCSGRNEETSTPSFAELMQRALDAPDLAHMTVRSIQRRVRAYLRAAAWERDLVAWVLGYADPTGETAVRNVMRGMR